MIAVLHVVRWTRGVNLVLNLGVSWIRVRKIRFFPRQISEKFRFSEGILLKKFDFPGNFTKYFDFPGKHWPFTATSGQIILFLFKSHHFRTYFLYIIRYNNISRPVREPLRPPAQNLGVSTPNTLRIDAPVCVGVCVGMCLCVVCVSVCLCVGVCWCVCVCCVCVHVRCRVCVNTEGTCVVSLRRRIQRHVGSLSDDDDYCNDSVYSPTSAAEAASAAAVVGLGGDAVTLQRPWHCYQRTSSSSDDVLKAVNDRLHLRFLSPDAAACCCGDA